MKPLAQYLPDGPIIPPGCAFKGNAFDQSSMRRIINGVSPFVEAYFIGSTTYGQIQAAHRITEIAEVIRAVDATKPTYACATGATPRTAIASGDKLYTHPQIDGIVVTTPGYTRLEAPADVDVDNHLRTVTRHFQGGDKPVLFYHIPKRSRGEGISLATLDELISDNAIHAIKYSAGDETFLQELRNRQNEHFKVYLGAEPLERQAVSGTPVNGFVHSGYNVLPGVAKIHSLAVQENHALLEAYLTILEGVQTEVYGVDDTGNRNITGGIALTLFGLYGYASEGVEVWGSKLDAERPTETRFEAAKRFILGAVEKQDELGPLLPADVDTEAIPRRRYADFAALWR